MWIKLPLVKILLVYPFKNLKMFSSYLNCALYIHGDVGVREKFLVRPFYKT